jgi:APA family basic amino acid/polyamine antiporter
MGSTAWAQARNCFNKNKTLFLETDNPLMSIKPKLSRFDLTMIVISLVIGMGIFKTPNVVAQSTGSTWIFFGAWLFGGLITLFGALTFAEIGSRYPSTGGFYKVLSYCYHPAFAFMITWVQLISNAASVAAIALIGSEYITPMLLPASLQNPTGIKITTITSVLILYVINFLGVKMSARAQNALTIFKVTMILLLCTAVFKHDVPPPLPYTLTRHHGLLVTIGLCLIPVFFTYTGYGLTINFGGDVINPKSNIPKAIFWGIGAVISLYMLINFAYFKVLGLGGLQQTPALAAKMTEIIFGPIAYKITSVFMFLSVLAYVNVNILANPRVYYAMAEDGILPQIFKRVNPRTQVQEFGMSFFVGTVIIILFFVGTFARLLDYTMFFETIGISLAALSIFILRKKTKQLNGSGIYTVDKYMLMPIVFILTYWFVTLTIFVQTPKAALVCAGAFFVGLVIYYVSVRKVEEN